MDPDRFFKQGCDRDEKNFNKVWLIRITILIVILIAIENKNDLFKKGNYSLFEMVGYSCTV